MDPGTWIMAASAVIGAMGAMDSASAASANYQSQAQAAQTNAEIARGNARNAGLVGSANEEAQRRKSAYTLSQQRAALGQSGLALEGSLADVYEQSVANAELDALNIRYQSALQAQNYLNQGGMLEAESSGAKRSASNTEEAGVLNAATSLLGGGTKIWSNT